MTSSGHPQPTLRLNPVFRLQWEPAQQAHVLLYPEGMVKLNDSAAEILKLCDGSRNRDELVTALEVAFDTSGLAEDVHAFVEHAQERGWLIMGC